MAKKIEVRHIDEISTLEITEMTYADILIILREKILCEDCGKCILGSKDCLKFQGTDVDGNCRNTANKVIDVLERLEKEREEEEKKSKNIETENFYSSSIKFMKNHGYSRCYMCGSSLEGLK